MAEIYNKKSIKKEKNKPKNKKIKSKSKVQAKAKYLKDLRKLQVELLKFQYYVKEKGLKILIIMEGRDAAGKGGTIKRITEHLNPRGCRIVALPKPSDVETTQWYFQRYTAHLPSGGEIVIFDRSWYNRAMVEPVMGFCTPKQHTDFLRETPNFENLLDNADIKIFKIFLSINKETQAKRFKDRRKDPLKSYKISPVDEKALGLWDKYSMAQYNMFLQTDTELNPWVIIDSNDKQEARLNVLRAILSKVEYKDKGDESMFKIDKKYIRNGQEEIKEFENLLDGIYIYPSGQ